MKKAARWVLGAGLVSLSSTVSAQTWTPLISSSSFTGINTDCGTAASGIVGCCLIVLGIGILIKVLAR